MPTPANGVGVALFEGRINILNGNAGETTPTEQDTVTTPAFESGTSLAPLFDLAPNADCSMILSQPQHSACRRVIRRSFAPHGLPSLIEAIFSSKDEGNTIRCLPRNDAQTFVDVMNEARSAFAPSTEIDTNLPHRLGA